MPNQYFGLSTDGKPLDVPIGSIYMEIDTCKFYYFNGYSWEEMPCYCESSNGIPYSKKITVTANETARQNFIDFDHEIHEYYLRTVFYNNNVYYSSWWAYTPPIGTEWIFYSIYDDPFIINISSTYTGEPDEMIVTGDATVEQDQYYDGHWIITVTGDCTITLKENPNP